MARLFTVTLEYQNIESAGSARLTTSYNLEAADHVRAAAAGIERLGCNRDGKLFSVKAEEIFIDR